MNISDKNGNRIEADLNESVLDKLPTLSNKELVDYMHQALFLKGLVDAILETGHSVLRWRNL